MPVWIAFPAEQESWRYISSVISSRPARQMQRAPEWLNIFAEQLMSENGSLAHVPVVVATKARDSSLIVRRDGSVFIQVAGHLIGDDRRARAAVAHCVAHFLMEWPARPGQSIPSGNPKALAVLARGAVAARTYARRSAAGFAALWAGTALTAAALFLGGVLGSAAGVVSFAVAMGYGAACMRPYLVAGRMADLLPEREDRSEGRIVRAARVLYRAEQRADHDAARLLGDKAPVLDMLHAVAQKTPRWSETLRRILGRVADMGSVPTMEERRVALMAASPVPAPSRNSFRRRTDATYAAQRATAAPEQRSGRRRLAGVAPAAHRVRRGVVQPPPRREAAGTPPAAAGKR